MTTDHAVIAWELRALEQSLLDPAVRCSPERVALMLAAEFREFGTSGRTYDKTSVISAMLSAPPCTVTLSDFDARCLHPDVYLVTFRTTRFDDSGVPVSRSLRSSVWQRRDARWQLVFHQGTRVPGPDADGAR